MIQAFNDQGLDCPDPVLAAHKTLAVELRVTFFQSAQTFVDAVLAEQALLRLIGALQDHDVPIVVLGGLVPEVLTRDQEPPAPQHLGTTDVDIHLGLGLQVEAEQDLAQLETALTAADFRPDETKEGWRWETRVQGARVNIEFLCELDNQPQEAIVTPVGCEKLTAVNLRGTGFVTEDFEWVELTGKLTNGTTITARVRFAGLEGYLMSKAHVAWRRGLDKDYYDLVYTLLYNRLGGPKEAAEALARSRFRDRIKLSSGPWPEIRARFTGASDTGPKSYADQATQADPETDHAQARQDAVGAIAEFLDRLDGIIATQDYPSHARRSLRVSRGMQRSPNPEAPRKPDIENVRTQIEVLNPVADAFLIPDNHLGRATVSSDAVAHEVAYMGGRSIACLNARDRNLLGFRRDLLTAASYGVDHFLFVYGDPPKEGRRTEDLSVRGMIDEVRGFGTGPLFQGYPDFRIGTVVKPGRDLAWRRRADFVFVQISFNLDRLIRWRHTLDFDGKLYAGVIVLASARMARSIAASIPDIRIPQTIVDKLEDDPDVGVDIALDQIEEIKNSGTFDGIHLVPVGRYRAIAKRLGRPAHS